MYKLIILIESEAIREELERRWPEFLAVAEQMPGLLRETTSRVDRVVHGGYGAQLVHELFFESLKAAAEAMGSPEGERAGQLLQEISGGKVSLLLADHTQDELSNIRRHSQASDDIPPGDRA
ncbi:MAG: hypothetical protein DWG76_00280 [Chloroflexi bacterium]|nr:hypothetical protein [Chloroflexota bacterium]